METKIKDMNKEQRFAHCMMMFKTYAEMMTYFAIDETYKKDFEEWRRRTRNTWKILHNMAVMQGRKIDLYEVLLL